jgi:hypothetical protein
MKEHILTVSDRRVLKERQSNRLEKTSEEQHYFYSSHNIIPEIK